MCVWWAYRERERRRDVIERDRIVWNFYRGGCIWLIVVCSSYNLSYTQLGPGKKVGIEEPGGG